MYYKVSARLRTETVAELHRRLNDGSVQAQKPDGQEIVNSMQRAVMTDDGKILWSEACHCETPLYHERTTVYDQHFDEFETEIIDGHENYKGRPFLEYLAEAASASE